jgi:NNP family nitrate/nitrite transporter-like MFS transporter
MYSTLSALRSRLGNERDLPPWPMAMPSLTAMVLNSTPPGVDDFLHLLTDIVQMHVAGAELGEAVGDAVHGRGVGGRRKPQRPTSKVMSTSAANRSYPLPKALGQWFPQREFGFANGAALAGNGAGQAIALSAGPLLLEPLGGWRAITRMLGLFLLGLGVLWIVTLRDREGSVGGGGNALASLRAVTRIPAVWVLSGAYMLFLGGYIGVIQYLPTYYEEVRGMSKATAGGMMSLVLLAFIAGSLMLPTLSDRLGLRKRVYFPGMLLSAGLVFAAAVMTGMPLVAVLVAWGLSAGVVAILFVVPLELAGVGPAYAGSALGLALTAGFGGGFVSPIVGSTLAAANPFAGIGFWTACYAGSAFLFLLVPETGPRAQREVASAPLR